MNNIKTSPSGVNTSEGNLILDNHKLSYHYQRFQDWVNGSKVAPVSVDMALTRSCGAMCKFCYAMVQEPQERSAIKIKDALNLADDFAEIIFLSKYVGDYNITKYGSKLTLENAGKTLVVERIQ